jgi:uracil phosphoribosyltransferase
MTTVKIDHLITTLNKAPLSFKGPTFRKVADQLISVLAGMVSINRNVKWNDAQIPFAHNVHLVVIGRSGYAMLEKFRTQLCIGGRDVISVISMSRKVTENVGDVERAIAEKYGLKVPQVTVSVSATIDAKYTRFGSPKKDDIFIILEPMLATGTTLKLAIAKLAEKFGKGRMYVVASLYATNVGKFRIREYTNAITNGVKFIHLATGQLNDHQYIYPGPGDFGDKYYPDFTAKQLFEYYEGKSSYSHSDYLHLPTAIMYYQSTMASVSKYAELSDSEKAVQSVKELKLILEYLDKVSKHMS